MHDGVVFVSPQVGVRIVVAGAGFAGLATALALKDSGHEVVIVERDPEPPRLAPEQAFDGWARPGVPQFRHAHMFLARLQTMLRDQHPELLAELKAAGLELSSLDELLPPTQRDSYRPLPDDRDLLHLWGRRPTFEYVLRQHVARLPHVRFIHNCRVEGLRADSNGGEVRVRGLDVTRNGVREAIDADLVVDASGKRTRSPEWLRALGVEVSVHALPSNYAYVCRHYRYADRASMPRRCGTGANLDYFGYVIFYAEHGHFAVTLSCPVEEAEFARLVRTPEGFDSVCEKIPVLAQWTRKAKVTSKVLGAGRFENRWTHYGAPGGLPLSGFVALGDSHIETNPMYGRGCTLAFVQAQLLAEALAVAGDQRAQLRKYYARTREVLKPHFDFCVQADRMFQNRAKVSRGERIAFGDRVLRYAYERAYVPAIQASPLVAREMVKATEMREPSSFGLRLAMLFQIARAWLLGLVRPGRVPPIDLGPPRRDFLDSLAPGPAEPAAAAPSARFARSALLQEGERGATHEAANRIDEPEWQEA